MSKARRARNRYRFPPKSAWPLCRYCGKPIRPGEESSYVYDPVQRPETQGITTHGPMHAYHVPLEDHPLFDQMPFIIYSGLPDESLITDEWR
jgi:hypothetical protein